MKNCRLPTADCRLPDQLRGCMGVSRSIVNRQSSIVNGFTLLELLAVITILGILAGLAVPALKNIGKSDIQVSATRQLMDDVARARQLAIGQRTTVYMVFVPDQAYWWNTLPLSQRAAGTNLLDKQMTGYTFVTLRSAGDQPGQGVSRYLSDWKSLPEGAFVATNKFNPAFSRPFYYPVTNTISILPPVYDVYRVSAFSYTNSLPFPTETNTTFVGAAPWLPYIAFNYLGQLTVDGVNGSAFDVYIPLAQGNAVFAVDAKKNLVPGPADFSENPAGNSTNSMFHLIRIDHLTGRATLLQQKVQ